MWCRPTYWLLFKMLVFVYKSVILRGFLCFTTRNDIHASDKKWRITMYFLRFMKNSLVMSYLFFLCHIWLADHIRQHCLLSVNRAAKAIKIYWSYNHATNYGRCIQRLFMALCSHWPNRLGQFLKNFFGEVIYTLCNSYLLALQLKSDIFFKLRVCFHENIHTFDQNAWYARNTVVEKKGKYNYFAAFLTNVKCFTRIMLHSSGLVPFPSNIWYALFSC